MDWSDLPFFLAIARTGQIGRAARVTGADATTVGRRLRRLEQALGERLFEQDGTDQVLTAAGASLLDRVEAMARIADGIDHDHPRGRALRGTIRVSVSEGFGTWFIGRHLGELADAHPGLEVDLVANSGFLSPTRRETDLAVLLARPQRGPLVTRKLTDYRLDLYAAAAYLADRPAIAHSADLSAHRLVGYIPDAIYAPELRYLEEFPHRLRAQLRSSSINAQHAMIAAGAGIGVLPRFIGASDPTLRRLLPETAITRTFWLVTHQETHKFRHVRAFTHWLLDLTARHRELLTGPGGG